MTLEMLQELCMNKTIEEKMEILIQQVDTYGDDRANMKDALHRENNDEYRYWESEAKAMMERILWIGQAVVMASEVRSNTEPRVLTAEELRQLPAQTIVWVDYWDGEEKKLGTMMAGMKCYDGTLVDEDACVYNDFEHDMTPDRFDGSCWRFWLGKPTDDQRKAVPWE